MPSDKHLPAATTQNTAEYSRQKLSLVKEKKLCDRGKSDSGGFIFVFLRVRVPSITACCVLGAQPVAVARAHRRRWCHTAMGISVGGGFG